MQMFHLGIALIVLAAILVGLMANIVKTLKSRRIAVGASPKVKNVAELPKGAMKADDDADRAAPPGRMRKLVAIADMPVEQLLARADAPAGYLTALEHRLEQAFESYLRERISIETYADIIRSEKRAAHQFQAELSSRTLAWPDPTLMGFSPEDEDIFRQIDEALTWCHDWALERGAKPAGFALAANDVLP